MWRYRTLTARCICFPRSESRQLWTYLGGYFSRSPSFFSPHFHTRTHRRKEKKKEKLKNFSKSAKTLMVHQIIVANSHSLRANTCSVLYPHPLVYSECVQAHSLTDNAVGVYTHMHTQTHTHARTHTPSLNHSTQKSTKILVLPDGACNVCVITALVFWSMMLPCVWVLMCVCLCVYVWAISPALVYSVCVCVCVIFFVVVAFSLSFFLCL